MNPAKKSADVHATLAAAFNTGDVATLLGMYDFNGLFVPDSGHPLSGKQKFEETIQSIIDIPGTMEIKTVYCVETGDIAVGRSEWSITDNGEVKVSAKGIEVMKQQPDGSWKVIIDHAFGAM